VKEVARKTTNAKAVWCAEKITAKPTIRMPTQKPTAVRRSERSATVEKAT